MRVTRVIAGLATAIAAVLGIILATAGSASAAETGTWRAYGNTNPVTSSSSTWHCASTVNVSYTVKAQVCAIRSASGTGVQAAVIVRNNGTGLFVGPASMDLATRTVYLGRWDCPAGWGVKPGTWSVCFGRTLTQSSPVNSSGNLVGTALGGSPFV
jgi:hypothetical protein